MAWNPPNTIQHTLDDWLATPEDDGNRYELIDGRIVVSPHAGTTHNRISRTLMLQLTLWQEGHGLGEVFGEPNVALNSGNAVIPDAVIVLDTCPCAIVEWGLRGVPTVIIEILSPSNREYDMTTKRALYEQNSVPEYWIVDPESRIITCLLLTEGRYVEAATAIERLISPTIPHLEIDVVKLFKPR